MRPRPIFPVAAVVLFGLIALARHARARYLRVEVAGESMAPALRPGDCVIVRRGAPPHGAAAAGHVVLVEAATGRALLKRVVGLPGESLRVGERVSVDGRTLDEVYASAPGAAAGGGADRRLGADEYYVLGDRRAASTDSRAFGPVRRDAIRGVAVARYWPPSRIGRLSVPPRAYAPDRGEGR